MPLLKFKSKPKLAKLQCIEDPAGYLAPLGRANQQQHVEEAHSCGEFLAAKGTTILCTPPQGEVGIAMVTGALSTGGEVNIYTDTSTRASTPLEGAKIIDKDHNAQRQVLAEISHFWVMPPTFSDLERYLQVWIASGYRPLVCLSPQDEFLLLRGFVQDIVSVGSPMSAERLIFARTQEEGWEKLSELLVN